MEGKLERYVKIGFRASFSISYRYPIACEELSSIIRLFYSTLPKPLHSILFQDALFAFHLLPEMQTQSAVSAAYKLIQSIEAALPKQKKVMAVKEFKQAMVAHKRRKKCQQEDRELVELPQDILLHLFSFLDMQSLVSAGMVCRSWNAAASDNCLWQAHFFTYFEDKDTECRDKFHVSSMHMTDLKHSAPTDAADRSLYNFKNAFRRKYRVSPSLRYKHNRAYCGRCNTLVWLSNLKCPNIHVESRSLYPIMKPILAADQVAYFLFDGLPPSFIDNESSESDEEAGLKLWAYPKELVNV
ncbi:hypothetical protein V2J09_011206 [Rumex salicifolius]